MKTKAEFEIRGHVGKIEPGDKVTYVSIAAERGWKDRESGEWKSETIWNRVTVFGDQRRRFISEHVGVGDLVSVEGILFDNSYEKNGETVWTVERQVSEFDLLAKKGD